MPMSSAPASVAHLPATAILKDARVAVDGPTLSAPPWLLPPPSRDISPTCAVGTEYGTSPRSYRNRGAARSCRRGHRSDHPQAVSEAHRAYRLRRISFLRLALHARRPTPSRLCSEPGAVRSRLGLGGGPQFRVRFFARARGVGAA